MLYAHHGCKRALREPHMEAPQCDAQQYDRPVLPFVGRHNRRYSRVNIEQSD